VQRRSPAAQSSHDAEVRQQYIRLVRDPEWSNVTADTPGAPAPGIYNGHVPDLTGTWQRRFFLIEVETADSYAGEHAKSQYRAFAAAGELIVDVPAAVADSTKQLLTSMSIKAIVWAY
jgi:hypothetical protein